MIRFTSDITVEQIQSMGGDHMVVHAARVSTHGSACREAIADEDGGFGLINYLMKYRHGTPFEHAALTMFVHAPAFVWWEWTRHRIGHSYNLESARYKQLEPVFWIPRETRAMIADDGHKPSRPKFKAASSLLHHAAVDVLQSSYQESWRAYLGLVECGIATEVARAALPFAVYYAGWVTVNPRSLMAFLSLRTHDETANFVSFPQAEIEEAARAAEAILAEGWPLTYRAFKENGRVGP